MVDGVVNGVVDGVVKHIIGGEFKFSIELNGKGNAMKKY